jgi:tripartite-type tricarboxylate transporter receptor subunit TctC
MSKPFIPSALAVLVAAVLAIDARQTHAQSYPDKPIRLVVAFPAGGAADLVGRAIAQRLTEQWKQQVIVDNRSGAGGVVGTEIASRAGTDGYTILFGSSSTFATGPVLNPKLPYHPQRDFSPITLTTLIPNIMVAHASVPVHSIKELVEYAKAKPKQLSYASNGAATASHIAGELFRHRAGIQWIHVPYKGAGPAIGDVVGGHVQFLIGAISTSMPHMKSGKIRGIAVTSLKRSSAIPDVPTIAESGFPGFDVVQWFGLLAPAKTPAAIVQKWNTAVVEMHREAEFAERFKSRGLEPVTNAPKEFAAFIQKELPMGTQVFKEVGITLS